MRKKIIVLIFVCALSITGCTFTYPFVSAGTSVMVSAPHKEMRSRINLNKKDVGRWEK